MDKSWIWKKKSTEKSIVVDEKPNTLLNKNEEKAAMSNKTEFERDRRVLHDNFSSILSESGARDELAKKQARIAREAIAGWEMSETEAISLKLELEKALQQRAASEERLIHMDAALKECMQQLRFAREEQEKRIHNAVMKASNEFQRSSMELHAKLDEASKRLARVDSENTQLGKALLMKDKVIEDLSKHRTRAEIDFSTLMTRLESTEKENASLKYELRVLEKELEIRNEEREFNRRTADVSQKQHLEDVKKITKLESECQRLRLLVRKRLPGPAALAKMKNEVETLSKDQPETRGRKSNPSSLDFSVDMASETPGKQIKYLTEQLFVIEEENKTLKEALDKRKNELQFSRTMFAQTASKLAQLEGQLGSHSVAEPGKTLNSTHELSLASMSDMGSDDKVSCAESWASALLSELEQFKNGKQEGMASSRMVGASDMSLMDDFVEMEKLAVVAVDNAPIENGNHVRENKVAHSHSEVQSSRNVSEVAVAAIIPGPSDMSISTHQYQSKDVTNNKSPSWLEEILKIILEKSEAIQRNPDDILEEIKGALPRESHPNSQCVASKESSSHLDIFGSLNNMAQRPPDDSLTLNTGAGAGSDNSTAKKSSQKVQSNLSTSINKIVEFIEGISMQSLHDGTSEVYTRKNDFHYRNSEASMGYVVRLFQWKSSELSVTLKQFVQVCNDLLNGKCDLESFAEQLKCTLDWIMNHCFSLQDVSSMKDAIKNHLDWDDSRSESEFDSGMMNHFSESSKMHGHVEDDPSPSPFVSGRNYHNIHFQVEDIQPRGKGEDGTLEDESSRESEKKDMEGRLRAEIFKSESLMTQLQESGKTIESLQKEVETLKQLKENIADESKKHKMVKEDLEMQLTIKSELSKAGEEVKSQEKEMENKNNSSETLEPTSHDVHLKLESVNKRETPEDKQHTGGQLRTESEIATASEKLAECQETIFNLGKQLKALASPQEAALFDKVILTPTDNNAASATATKVISNPTETIITSMTPPEKKVHQRLSLLDKMLAEDKADTEDLKSSNEEPDSLKRSNPTEVDHRKNDVLIGPLAIVPSKKKAGRGILRKLLGMGKKKSGKKNDLLIC